MNFNQLVARMVALQIARDLLEGNEEKKQEAQNRYLQHVGAMTDDERRQFDEWVLIYLCELA